MYSSRVTNGRKEVIASQSIVVQDVDQPISVKLEMDDEVVHEFIFKIKVLPENTSDSGKFNSKIISKNKQEISVRVKTGIDYLLTAPDPISVIKGGHELFLGLKFDVSVLGDVFFSYTFMIERSEEKPKKVKD